MTVTINGNGPGNWDSSGNLGIGTTSPSNYGKLAVVQSAQSTAALFSNTNASWASDVVNSYSPSGTEVSNIGLSARSDGSTWVSSSYGAMLFRTGTSNSASERMRIDSSGIITGTAGNLMLVSGTAVATTSGTTVDFTGIPTWAKKITVVWNNVSLTTADKQFVRLGTAGGIAVSGYKCGYGSMAGTGGATDLFWYAAEGTASQFNSGVMTIINIDGNSWSQSCNTTRYSSNGFVSAGGITLGGALTTVRIGNDGTGTFDSGTVNIFYE